MATDLHPLDTVRLTQPVDGLAPGTVGTVVEDLGEQALVEVAEQQSRGALLEDLVVVPYASLELVQRAPVAAR
jgi:hypothetical protein